MSPSHGFTHKLNLKPHKRTETSNEDRGHVGCLANEDGQLGVRRLNRGIFLSNELPKRGASVISNDFREITA